MNTALLFALLSSSLYYLGSRALITQWLWSRYPQPIAKLADCSACSGFWYGAAVAATVGRWAHMSYLGLDPQSWWSVPIVGACSIAATPIAFGVMQWGLDRGGTAVFEEDHAER